MPLSAWGTAGGRRQPASRFGFVLRRVLWMGPLVIAVVVITFGLMHLAPGNPWQSGSLRAGHLNFSDSAVANLRTKYGLDEPLWRQLLRYLGNAARLDFGDSFQYQGNHVRDLIIERLPETVILGTITFGVVLVAGVGLGMVSAIRRSSPVDYLVTGLSTLGASLPSFVVGILLILLASVGLRRATGGRFYLPDGGFGLDAHLVLPVITLGLLPMAFIARLTRASALDALGAEHVRTARAKGLRERRVLLRHVLDNALLPVVTAVGPMFAYLITGSMIVESLFQIRGVSGAFVAAITARDYPMILGCTVVFAVVFALANLAVDVAYALLDPRVDAR